MLLAAVLAGFGLAERKDRSNFRVPLLLLFSWVEAVDADLMRPASCNGLLVSDLSLDGSKDSPAIAGRVSECNLFLPGPRQRSCLLIADETRGPFSFRG